MSNVSVNTISPWPPVAARGDTQYQEHCMLRKSLKSCIDPIVHWVQQVSVILLLYLSFLPSQLLQSCLLIQVSTIPPCNYGPFWALVYPLCHQVYCRAVKKVRATSSGNGLNCLHWKKEGDFALIVLHRRYLS